METKCRMYERLKVGCVVLIIACMTVLNVRVSETYAQPAEPPSTTDTVVEVDTVSQAEEPGVSEIVLDAKPETKSKPATAGKKALDEAIEQPDTSPRTEKTSSSNTLLYAGVGVGAAVALAVSLGGGGSSSSSEPVEPPKEPVGADIAGDNWSGRLLLVDGERELVTAVVHQNGSDVEIITSSTQEYGQRFVGTIKSNGHMLLYEQVTGQDWTTHDGPASWNRIDISDYVHDFHELDNLFLSRDSK